MSLSRALAGLACALLPLVANAGEGCRIAFDMGSSGIRAGVSGSSTTLRADIDYLTPLWSGRGLEETVPLTIAALRELPTKTGFPADCRRVGGGFSAWRLALEQDAGALAGTLARIRAASGVAVLVMPQQVEGAYGYFGARQALGPRLTSSHVLDIGGGSLQLAGIKKSFGAALGQQAWHRLLCQALRSSTDATCALAPLSRVELAKARQLAAAQLADVSTALAGPVSLTAISRPVSRGVLPAVRRFGNPDGASDSLRRRDLSMAIERLAPLAPEASASLLGISPHFAAYLLSDLLLVEGILKRSHSDRLHVAEADITNLPGLLADDRAFAWSEHYTCYLQRLQSMGLSAYASDPATCQAEPLAADQAEGIVSSPKP